MFDIVSILQNNWTLFLIGQYPHGPLGGLANTLILAVLALVGCEHLAAHQPLMQMVKEQARAGRFYVAIAQAPVLVLQASGALKGRRMTCIESVSDQLVGCNYVDQPVVVDGNCITAQGSAAALNFALALVEQLCGKARRNALTNL